MNKYIFSFTGRQTQALGINYPITDEYTANSIEDAFTMLYTDYEHIQGLKCNGKLVDRKTIKFSDIKYTIKKDRK